jgi:DNA polymerase III subunit gamma/tau
LDKEQETAPLISKSASQQSEYTYEQLLAGWSEFADSIQYEMPRLYQAIKVKQPEKDSENLYKVKVDSELQKLEFQEKLASNLITFIRNKVNNALIEFRFEVAEANEPKKLIYSANDRYNFLLDLNKDLTLLKQTFNLDLE